MKEEVITDSDKLSEKDLQALLAKVLTKPAPGFEHLDLETAYCYAEGVLPEARMRELDEHVPFCGICLAHFEDVSGLVADEPALTVQAARPAVVREKTGFAVFPLIQSWLNGLRNPLTAAAALAVLLIAALSVLLFYRYSPKDNEATNFPTVTPTAPVPASTDPVPSPTAQIVNPPAKNTPAPENPVRPAASPKPVRKEAPLMAQKPVEKAPAYDGETVEKLQPIEETAGGDEPDVITVGPAATRKEFFVGVEDLDKSKRYSVELNGRTLSGNFKVSARRINGRKSYGFVVAYNPQEIRDELLTLKIRDANRMTVRKYKIRVKTVSGPSNRLEKP